jgi:tetratricopeptide (TPR) repeat protein
MDQVKKLVEEKNYDVAKKLLSPVENKDKDYALAQYYMGIIAYRQKMYDEAADYFEEAIEYNDKMADCYNWLGNTYGTIAQYSNLLIQGYLAPKMKNAWKKASELDTKNIQSRWALIQYYTQAPSFMGGSFEKAREMAAEIARLDKAEGHKALGTVYQWEKNMAEAEKEFLEMTKLNPALGYVLADFYTLQKKYDKAFALLEELIKNNPGDYLSHFYYGKTSVLTGQKSERAEEYLQKYLTYEPKENEPSLASANMLLAQIYEKKGNKTEARKFYSIALRENEHLKEAREGLERVTE